MKKQNFESALEELNQVVERIESGELTLEETLKAYEKGVKLERLLDELLKEGQGRVMQLTQQGEQPFAPEEEA